MPSIEYRVVGPPGCGKTTWLGNQVEQALESGKSVLISPDRRNPEPDGRVEITGQSAPSPLRWTQPAGAGGNSKRGEDDTPGGSSARPQDTGPAGNHVAPGQQR